METASQKSSLRTKKDYSGCLILFRNRTQYNTSVHDIQKYFPKYIRHLAVDIKSLDDGRIIRRLKSIKVIHSITSLGIRSSSKSFILNLLQGKRRYIRCLRGFNQDISKYFHSLSHINLKVYIFNSWRSFLFLRNMKTLSLNFDKDFYVGDKMAKKKIAKKLRWRLKTHLMHLNTLQNLQLVYSDYTRFFAYIILRFLNDLPQFLERLKVLKIDVARSRYIEIDSYNVQLQRIFKCINEVSIGNISSLTSDYLIRNMKHFANLVNLHLSFVKLEDEDGIQAWSFERLKSLKDLCRLTVLDLEVYLHSKKLFISYLQNLRFPESLESVTFAVREFAWETIFPFKFNLPKKESNPFEEHETFRAFYKNWEELKNLQCLNFYMKDTSKHSVWNDYFTTPILRRIPNLNKLCYTSQFTKTPQRTKIPLNLALIWNSIQHLSTSLETLHIEDFAISLRRFKDVGILVGLLDLNMQGLILDDDNNFPQFLKIFYKNNKNSAKSAILRVGSIVASKGTHFNRILESLEDVPRSMFLSLRVDAKKVCSKTVMKNIYQFIEKARIKGSILLTITNVNRIKTTELNAVRRKALERPIFTGFSIEVRGRGRVVLNSEFERVDQIIESESDDESSQESFEELRSSFKFIECDIIDDFSYILDI